MGVFFHMKKHPYWLILFVRKTCQKKGRRSARRRGRLAYNGLIPVDPDPSSSRVPGVWVIALRLLAYLLRVWFGWVWGVQPPSKDMVVGALGLGRSNMFFSVAVATIWSSLSWEILLVKHCQPSEVGGLPTTA